MARLQSLRDAPGTSREYETVYILRPNTANDGVAEINTKVKGIIEGMGGKILKVDNWGKRRLAYEVAKERKGIYLYWRYLATAGVVEETEQDGRLLFKIVSQVDVARLLRELQAALPKPKHSDGKPSVLLCAPAIKSCGYCSRP